MKTTAIKTFIAVLMGFLFMPTYGQEVREAYLKTMDKIFSGIPVEKVTTGILIERAPSFVNMFRYEKEYEEIVDTCNVHKWKQMVLQLNMAHLDSSKFNYYISHFGENERKNIFARGVTTKQSGIFERFPDCFTLRVRNDVNIKCTHNEIIN